MANSSFLYKYCRLPDSQYWETMLSKIQFKRISYLNDPFEGFLKARDEDENIIQKISPDTYIASFSLVRPYTPTKTIPIKIQSNIYMWSHYADSMNGICIEYKRVSNARPKGEITKKKVSYTIKYPQDEKIDPFIKYKSWQFEREFRFTLKHKEKKDIDVYRENSECDLKIHRIFLGVRLSGKDKNHGGSTIVAKMESLPIVIYIKKQFPDIPIYVCVRHRKSFKVVKLKKVV